jgi:outer membrane protein assembly factor BamD (BamD/ComL family)
MNAEETQSDKSLELLTWLEVNKKNLMFAGIGALVIVCAIYIYNTQKEATETEANQALVMLPRPIDAMGRQGEVSSADLLKVVEKYPSTRAAERALLEAGTALFYEQKFPEARAKFEEFTTKYPNSAHLAAAEYGKAACLDGQNQVDSALSAYQQIVTRFGGDPVATQAKIAIGVIYESKKQPEQALKQYDEVRQGSPRSFNQSQWLREVGSFMSHLTVEYPDLGKTPAPVTTSRPMDLKPGEIPIIDSAPKTSNRTTTPTVVTPPTPPAPAPNTKK